MKTDADHRSPERIESDIARTRAEMDATLSAIDNARQGNSQPRRCSTGLSANGRSRSR